MSSYSLVFQPWFPVWLLAVLAVLALLAVGYGILRRAKGAWVRLVLAALLLGALANPVLHQELRQPLPDTVVLAVDRSASQKLGDRPAETDAAVAALRERLQGMSGLELREVAVDDRGNAGTPLFGSLREALAEIDAQRLAGVIAITDGQIHDVPPTDRSGLEAPLHVLLTGRPDESDRMLAVDQAPTFGMVGEPQSLTVRIDELPGERPGDPVPVTLRQDGRVVGQTSIVPGTTATLPFTLDKAGTSVLEVEAETRPGELTPLNNRTALFVNGVRDRLRVLLVSGQPYPGLRVWRNLLKADPAVDLVHFTILRPPEKQDGTPIRELALIAFPSRELFEVKLDEFDLIIFDRYSRRGLLPLVYLDNIARYVEQGGALLEAAGPEFAEPTSLYRTPLARVLPGRPSGQVFDRGYVPTLTDLGNRHPVTAGLRAEAGGAAWGRWFRQVDAETDSGEVLMTGVADRPLLVLKHAGEGRVAQLLSDHAWLWARGFEGGGPQSLLLRRLVHWLMREPELEEEQLLARAAGEGLAIERRSLQQQPVEVTVTAPSGAEQRLTLTPGADGRAETRIDVAEDGLYRVGDGTRTAYAAPRPISPAELADMRATPDRLAPVAEATMGSIRWLSEAGLPDIRRTDPGRAASGRGWIGLRANGAYEVQGALQLPLLPAWLALALMLAAAGLAWWREGRS
ncbi:MAG TPA: hypothetical protein PKA13_09055 [Geminicoccaceae bacterium]|nr:hypothetical protein [Geminicoccus sp.]HMU49912.1 hypothetical protein [Geminicoccaceae bacterium]